MVFELLSKVNPKAMLAYLYWISYWEDETNQENYDSFMYSAYKYLQRVR